ncbi:MAG TPA: hypothetical protein VKK31_08325 [Thermoanaerobaculia bacterium]|nr:hypothetical protein [Thermoanaerobaculia bacterium]
MGGRLRGRRSRLPAGALLEELVASRLALRTEEGWSFVHAMLRESVERMSREAGRFAAHNHACAAMLAGRAAAGERGTAERLGHHLLLAGERAAALEPLLDGARERRGTSDYPAAHGLLDERETALRDLGVSEGDPRWGQGWVVRARIHLHQGRLEDVFRWAEPAAGEDSESWATIRSEALRLLGDAARRQGDLDRAAHLYERCIVLPDNPHGAAASLWGLGDVAASAVAWRRPGPSSTARWDSTRRSGTSTAWPITGSAPPTWPGSGAISPWRETSTARPALSSKSSATTMEWPEA